MYSICLGKLRKPDNDKKRYGRYKKDQTKTSGNEEYDVFDEKYIR
jgi:hypothetical protein